MSFLSSVIPILGGICGLSSLFGGRDESPIHLFIEQMSQLRRDVEKSNKAVEFALAESDEQRRKADESYKRLQETQGALEKAREEVHRDAEKHAEALAAVERAAADERVAAVSREQKIRSDAETAAKEAKRLQEVAEKEIKQAAEDREAAEEAARNAAENLREANKAKEELERKLREGIQPEVLPTDSELEEAKAKIKYQPGLFHCGIAGIAGCGKSSLINGLRGLRPKDLGSAAVGVTETTPCVTRYPDLNPDKNLVWYDIPGAGTLKVPDWLYFHKEGLYVFDALIVLIGDRFTATDIAILRNARRFEIPSYIVRSKSDAQIRNIRRDMGYISDEEDSVSDRVVIESKAKEQYIRETRENVMKNLKKAGLHDKRVYLVSTRAMTRVVEEDIPPAEKLIDEIALLEDLCGDALKQREKSKKMVS